MNDEHPFKGHLVIGVDPGLACGFATLIAGVFDTVELTWDEATYELERLLSRTRHTRRIVAVERFTFQASSTKKTRQYDALEFIGVARFLSTKYDATFLLQGASDAQKLGNPDQLRALGWWAKGKDHANKAGSQVAYALARTDPVRFAQLLSSSRVDQ